MDSTFKNVAKASPLTHLSRMPGSLVTLQTVASLIVLGAAAVGLLSLS